MCKGLENITGYRDGRGMTTDYRFSPDEFNEFYARFDAHNTEPTGKEQTSQSSPPLLIISSADVAKSLRRINPRRAADLDNIAGQTFKTCTSHGPHLLQNKPPLSHCQKRAKQISEWLPACHIDSIVMKCFERIILNHNQTFMPNTLDPLQLTYRPNRLTEDAVSSTIYTALTHLEN